MGKFDQVLGENKFLSFASKGAPAGTFAVLDLDGYEALSYLYEFTVTLISEDADVDLEKVLSHSATLTAYPKDKRFKPVTCSGILRSLEQMGQTHGYCLYRAVLVPRLWRLSLIKQSEIYVNQTIPQVVESLLRKAGLDFEWKLGGPSKRKVWPALCQYEESDLEFFSRLLEREGIYYFFDEKDGRDVLMLVDDRRYHAATARNVSYRPNDPVAETGLTDRTVQAFICQRRPTPRTVTLRNYNPDRASAGDLAVSAEVSPHGFGEMALYGEQYETKEEGQALARIRAEELACRANVFHGESHSALLWTGDFLALSNHFRSDFNGKYLVTSVRHKGTQARALLGGTSEPDGPPESPSGYYAEFTAIPADVQFRPERRTPKPKVSGTMTAFVDAEGAGTYAEVDERGRYKIQVPFDVTDKAAGRGSAWIRMATPYAGKDAGMHFPLHKGTEVLLSFVDGDPDRPIITAAVPNSLAASVVTRKNETQSVIHTAGDNHLVFEDREGHEAIRLESPAARTAIVLGAADGAPTGLTLNTEGDRTESTGGNKQEATEGNQTISVSGDVARRIFGKEVTIRHQGATDIMVGGGCEHKSRPEPKPRPWGASKPRSWSEANWLS
ncbi:MAG: type VI secretion system tip protein VgrG [Nitrospirota bacterium]|nr:type VI secretion system tip protein VgrG [Nitrospirota bacterium]MDE3242464.1 type VI secretion system tip protein VgrG [Nitrospirota bacterium]